MSDSVEQRMRDDWNARAREDASYYVAFGRRDQEPEEFFATAEEVVKGLEWELRRMPSGANRRAWRALEIGCGPGRIIRPMSKVFGEIHGVDVSDEMIAKARANLQGIPHAHVMPRAAPIWRRSPMKASTWFIPMPCSSTSRVPRSSSIICAKRAASLKPAG